MKKHYLMGYLAILMSLLSLNSNAQACSVDIAWQEFGDLLVLSAITDDSDATFLWYQESELIGTGPEITFDMCEPMDSYVCVASLSPDCQSEDCTDLIWEGGCNTCPEIIDVNWNSCDSVYVSVIDADADYYIWDFGDGLTETTTWHGTTHHFDYNGFYTLCVGIVGGACDGLELCTVVNSDCEPVNCNSEIGVNDLGYDSYFLYPFGDVSDELTYTWLLNGTFYSSATTIYTGTLDPGVYEFCLHVTGLECESVSCTTLVVDDPGCELGIVATNLTCGYYYFELSQQVPGAQVEWWVGDESFTAGEFISYLFNEDGIYDVCATVVGGQSECEFDTVCQTVEVDVCIDNCTAEFYWGNQNDGAILFTPEIGCVDDVYFAWWVDGVYVSDYCELLYYDMLPGEHTICLSVEGSNCYDEWCTDIWIDDVPCPEWIQVDEGNECGNYLFSLYGGNDFAFAEWWTSDGQTFFGEVAEFQLEPGIQWVCAYVAGNGNNCDGFELCESIEVPECPAECEASFDVVYTETDGYVEFDNTSTWTGVPIFCWYVNDVFYGLNEDFSFQFTTNGVYEICLQVLTPDCESWYCFEIVIDDFVENCPENIVKSYVDCNTVVFAVPGAEWVSWTFGDGSQEWANGPITHTYGWDDTFTVCAWTISNDCPNGVSLCTEVNIDGCFEDCLALFEVDPVAGNPGTYDFPNISTFNGGTPVYCWYVNGELIVISEEFSYSFMEPGTYEVCLLLTTGDCESWYCETIVVEEACDPCHLDIEINDLGSCQYEFIASMPFGTPTNVTWMLSNGVILEGESVTYSFDETGSYLVCATTSAEGCPDGASACTTIDVDCYNYCPDGFVCDPLDCGVYSFWVPGFEDATAMWEFGDGNSYWSFGNILWDFAPGTYEVCVTVVGCDPICQTLVVEPCGDCFVNATYTYQSDCTLAFFALGNAPDSEYVWDFGDESDLVYDNDPTHEFPGTGSYLVTVYMWSDAWGCETAQTMWVTVSCGGGCESVLQYFPYSCNGISFYIENADPQYSIIWDFGDGTNWDEYDAVEYEYPSGGTYTVCVDYFNTVCQEFDTQCVEVTVEGCEVPCEITAWYNVLNNNVVELFAESPVDAEITWYIGADGSTLTGSPAYYILPVDYSAFEICAFVQNEDCGIEDCFTIYPPGCPTQIVAEEIGCGQYILSVPGFEDEEMQWNFGDGNTGSGLGQLMWNFEPGEYGITVTYNDCPTLYQYLWVEDCGTCEISIDYNYEMDCIVSFLAQSDVPDAQFEWDFGDGTPIIQNDDPYHGFNQPGTYEVTVYMWSEEYSCDVSETFTIEVGECGGLCFVSTWYQIDTDNNLLYLGSQTYYGSEVTWNIGLDGSVLVGSSLTIELPENFDPFEVCASINDNGCEAESCFFVVDDNCSSSFTYQLLDDQSLSGQGSTVNDPTATYVWILDGEAIWDTEYLYIDFLPAGEHELCYQVISDEVSCTHCETILVGDGGCTGMNLFVEALQLWDGYGAVLYEIDQDGDIILEGGWDMSDEYYFGSDSFCLENGCYTLTLSGQGDLLEVLLFINLYAPDDALQLIDQTVDWENGTITIEFGLNSDCETSIQEGEWYAVDMYPNPANDMVTIISPTGADIQVFDLMGNLVIRQQSSRTTETLDVSQLSGGLYVVTVRHKGKAWTQRLEVIK